MLKLGVHNCSVIHGFWEILSMLRKFILMASSIRKSAQQHQITGFTLHTPTTLKPVDISIIQVADEATKSAQAHKQTQRDALHPFSLSINQVKRPSCCQAPLKMEPGKKDQLS